ncbi:hypothetical protein EDB84DRAFT_1555965 [Lactarius hengduanensis]|nr:hypothetical protein EDB84DRAFT_1555965 [Lactarius hengduanensis]
MSIKRYFSQVSTSKDEGPQKKVKPSESPDLPTLDNELLPLLDLSSPSLSSHDSITEHFDKIAEHLFQRSYLVCYSTKRDGSPKWVLYEFLEFEFYMIKAGCHPDPYTHDEAEQRLPGVWYFHRVPRYNGKAAAGYRSGSRKGLDLTIGTPDTPASSDSSPPIPVRGGILLRSLRRVSDSVVVSGPYLLVDELLRCSGSPGITELVTEKWFGEISAFRPPPSENPASAPAALFIGSKQTHTSSQIYKSSRIGIDLSNPSSSDRRLQYVCKPYRFYIIPRLLTANGRGQTFLGVYDHCVDTLQVSKPSLAGKIASLTGIQPQTVDKYLKAYRDALASGELEPFIGPGGKGAASSPVPFLQLVGAWRRRHVAE